MTSLFSSRLLFIWCLAVGAAQEPGDVQSLAPGKSISVLLTPEHSSSIRLDLSGAAAEEIFLDTAVPDISFRMVSSDGADLLSVHIATSGWTVIPLSAVGQREVRLVLSTESRLEGLPGVRVRAELHPVPLATLPAHIRAGRIFNSAQTLHRSLRSEDIRQAISEFQQAAAEWNRCGDLYGEVLALAGKGESQIELSQYTEAMQSLQHAIRLDLKNAYVRGWLFHLEARVYLDQWEPKRSKDLAQEELRLGQEIDDPALIALARTDLTGVAYWGEDPHANEIAQQAHAEAVAAGVPEALALERRWTGWLEENNEHNTRAASLMSEAEASFLQAGDLRTALEATGQVAQAVSLNGDLYSALTRFFELRSATRAAGNDLDYGVLMENIGTQYFELGNPRFANVYFHQAESAYTSAHFRHGLMLIHGQLCEAELGLNETSAATTHCRISLNLARQIQDPVFLGRALCRLGLADRMAGKLSRAFEDFANAARYSHIGNDLFWESEARIQLGELLEQQAKRQEALAEFEQAESLSKGVADPASLLEAQYAAARWYALNGQYTEADAKLAPVLEKLEAARQLVASSRLQASYFAAERKCYELAVELRMRQYEREPDGEADALALEMSDRGRARGLLDALSAKSASDARESSEAEARLMRAKLAVDRAFNHRLKLLVEGGAKHDLEANSTDLTQALVDLERIEDNVHADAGQATKPAPTMSAAEIEQATLSSGATFFEYALGQERSYLWVIGGGKVKSYVLPPRERLEEMVKEWRTLAAGRERAGADAAAKLRHLSARLSCALLADAVQPAMTRMVIVSDGELALLPFAALPENACSSTSGKPLAVEHEITLTPSLSVFLTRKPEQEKETFQGEVAIVADPVFDAADPRAAALKNGTPRHDSLPAVEPEAGAALPRLLNAGYEANAIRETVRKAAGIHHVFLAQGFDASLDTVLSPSMQQYRIWHLATHGVYDETMPQFSGLVFSLVRPDGGPRFGFLKAYDIARLNVHAELVVLSACDSAAGENLSGEGVMGLSYSFLRAGAREVVSTLWSVDDAKSSELMKAFYKELMRNGGNAAAALHQSQLTVMRQHENSVPYYWAGFELTSVGR
jgi:CHAT domain-containing protein